MKTRMVIGMLLGAFLTACASIPTGPNVTTSRVVENAPELNEQASGQEQVRPRRRSRTTRVTETPRKAQVEGELPTPDIGSPEWERAKAEDEDKERRLDRAIRSICRGC